MPQRDTVERPWVPSSQVPSRNTQVGVLSIRGNASCPEPELSHILTCDTAPQTMFLVTLPDTYNFGAFILSCWWGCCLLRPSTDHRIRSTPCIGTIVLHHHSLVLYATCAVHHSTWLVS
ncbi:uncharacterized protein VDAG_08618 [Verticillium dahliae VdLs.17]|uniref:Uncharacterized protein n=1 Tax=Verticillium dahliae (strain VdLs.17 / ATCC MYA-4575 / FGSC 10137) TaxID=498257 RepID=G2XEN3_VERDV|nr:uncharacterized protein VDAG_08618 [Verticillium dahliae VdLs.17]EGY18284.1 hypothetical protein VDAG_08618 [Verticillium dahliae VdLs.17]KAH6686109.1 hypothetical protein EV126DRAFT_446466 [Verticillium dahliae]